MNSYISKTLTGKSAVFLEEQGRYKKTISLLSSVLNFLTIFIRKYSMILKLNINLLTLYIDLLPAFQYIKEIVFLI